MRSYDYDDERSMTGRIMAVAAAVLIVAAGGFVLVRSATGGSSTAVDHPVDPTAAPTTDAAPSSTSVAPVPTLTIAPVTTGVSPSTEPPTTSTEPPTTTTTVATTDTTAPVPTTTPADVVAPTSTEAVAVPAPVVEAVVATAGSYAGLPDGSPAPVVAVFGTDSITLTGSVPSQQAADLVIMLSSSNSTTHAPVVNLLSIDPSVPASVGVRVVELTSTRFPAGSADVLPEHAHEFDRIAGILQAFPNTSLLVIGHSDQRGDEAVNFTLSEARARAVVTYLASLGIDGSRLSSRAVGESDLLTLADDTTALALNRRTEFVVYGLFAS